MLELRNRERLGEHICKILQCINFVHSNFFYINSISDVMLLDTYMLGLKVVGIILIEMNSTLIIPKDCSDTL